MKKTQKRDTLLATKTHRRELKVVETLSSSALVALAEDMIAPDGPPSVLDVRLTVFAESRSPSIRGEARLIHSRDNIAIWETDFTELAGTPIAKVTHTLTVTASSPSAEVPEARDRRAMGAQEERRAAIAEAAAEVIGRKGFAAASIREIADAAGMHVPTLYQYISSKEEVLELVYLWVIKDVMDNLAPALDPTLPPRERLIAVTVKLLEGNVKTPRHTGLLNRELRALSRSARSRVLNEYSEVMNAVAEIIKEGVALGEFRPVNASVVANFIDALCDMWALRQFAIGQFSIEEYRDEVVQYIKDGLFSSKS